MVECFPVIAIPVLAIGFMFTMFWLVTRGWRELAKIYSLTIPFAGERWYFQTGDIAGVSYLLIVGADPRGAYFSTFFPSAFFPRIFVPWEEIKGVEHCGTLIRYVRLEFLKAPRQVHSISGRLADKLERASGGIWNYQRADKTVFFGKD
jgi:hypothetical protein